MTKALETETELHFLSTQLLSHSLRKLFTSITRLKHSSTNDSFKNTEKHLNRRNQLQPWYVNTQNSCFLFFFVNKEPVWTNPGSRGWRRADNNDGIDGETPRCRLWGDLWEEKRWRFSRTRLYNHSFMWGTSRNAANQTEITPRSSVWSQPRWQNNLFFLKLSSFFGDEFM